jgi:hypothetical protein
VVALTEERPDINADAEGKVIELQSNAAAVVGFQVEIPDWLHFDTGIETIIASEACTARLNVGGVAAASGRTCVMSSCRNWSERMNTAKCPPSLIGTTAYSQIDSSSSSTHFSGGEFGKDRAGPSP